MGCPPPLVRHLLGTGTALIAALAVLSAACAGPDPAPSGSTPPTTPAGTPANGHAAHPTPSGPPSAPLRAGERFVTVRMPQPYRPAAPRGGTDEYRCFLVDPKLRRAAYLTGSRFLPGNADLVHHAIFFRVDASDVAAARRADAREPGPGWRCFGDAGIGGGAWVASWAPGVGETLLAPGIGYRLPPGGRLVMQVHYNLLASADRAGAADRSGMRLRLTERADLDPLATLLLPAPVELPCAPGERGALCDRDAAIRHLEDRFGAAAAARADGLSRLCTRGRGPTPGSTQSCDHPVLRAGTVHALGGHMHLLGRSITVELNPGTGRARTLLSVPAYDFDNQAMVALTKPIAVRPGDTLRVSCTHDSSLRRRLPQLKPLPPRYVVWGDGTSDEMCLGVVVWTDGR
jgi:hypothetical protein